VLLFQIRLDPRRLNSPEVTRRDTSEHIVPPNGETSGICPRQRRKACATLSEGQGRQRIERNQKANECIFRKWHLLHLTLDPSAFSKRFEKALPRTEGNVHFYFLLPVEVSHLGWSRLFFLHSYDLSGGKTLTVIVRVRETEQAEVSRSPLGGGVGAGGAAIL